MKSRHVTFFGRRRIRDRSREAAEGAGIQDFGLLVDAGNSPVVTSKEFQWALADFGLSTRARSRHASFGRGCVKSLDEKGCADSHAGIPAQRWLRDHRGQ
ncbi:MAG: hypothetical protein SXG53_15060 [Pseudomonadota bacterium]|nr:hypothetical protein [Pseudomonadota bacterium]